MWGRWEKTGGGGGIVRYVLATAALTTCTMSFDSAAETAPQASLSPQFLLVNG